MCEDTVEVGRFIEYRDVRQILNVKEHLEKRRADRNGLGCVLQQVGHGQSHVATLALVAVNMHFVDITTENGTRFVKDWHTPKTGVLQYFQGLFQSDGFLDGRQKFLLTH